MLEVVDPDVADVGTLGGFALQERQVVLVVLLEEEGLGAHVHRHVCTRLLLTCHGRGMLVSGVRARQMQAILLGGLPNVDVGFAAYGEAPRATINFVRRSH